MQIGLDDFGTGYASLTHLRRLPVTFVKIDQSFVQGLGVDQEDERIVAAVVDLAANLGLRSIAEGVETPDQLDRLRELGCDQAQGYLFARPLPPDDVARPSSTRPGERECASAAWRRARTLRASAHPIDPARTVSRDDRPTVPACLAAYIAASASAMSAPASTPRTSRRPHHTDARGRREAGGSDRERCRDRRRHPLPERQRLGAAGDVLAHEQELVTTQPAHDVISSHHPTQPATDLGEQ